MDAFCADMRKLSEKVDNNMDSQLALLNKDIASLRAEMKVLSERVGCLERKQAYMGALVDGLRDQAGYIERRQERMAERVGRLEKGQDKLPERLGRLEQEQAGADEWDVGDDAGRAFVSGGARRARGGRCRIVRDRGLNGSRPANGIPTHLYKLPLAIGQSWCFPKRRLYRGDRVFFTKYFNREFTLDTSIFSRYN